MGIPGHLTCLLRSLYTGQEATVRPGRGTTDWFQIGKGVHQGCILSPCLFNVYAEYIMRNTRLEEAQAGIKIARRNIKNLRCADDTTLMAESCGPLCCILKGDLHVKGSSCCGRNQNKKTDDWISVYNITAGIFLHHLVMKRIRTYHPLWHIYFEPKAIEKK